MEPDPVLLERLEAHLSTWLGAWPPSSELDVVGSEKRTTPGWDGRMFTVAGVATPEAAVLSVPPDQAAEVRALGADLDAVGAGIGAVFGRPGTPLFRGIFRWCHELRDLGDVGEWVPTDDPRVPEWLHPFNGEVLVAWDDDGRYGAGVGRKIHDQHGQELAVATEEHLRGRGLAKRLVAQAARRVADEGAVATYLHAPSNLASARTADAAGFPDVGWKILGLPIAS
ncbi:MAG TPA: GNAT family N-acetyltransferase [Acidimicrobiales bacterium]|nr:GNAT family N-acetyltransferase [Acidimicrobiales bacterium]